MKVARGDNYLKWLNDNTHYHHFVVTNNINDASIILFTGGQDINPSIYNEKAGSHTGISSYERDTEETVDFKHAVDNNKFMIGICRGAQLICALSGGSLIQHVGHHHSGHYIKDFETKRLVYVNSIHHQMMMPYNLNPSEYEIIAYSLKEHFNKSTLVYLDQNDKDYKITVNGEDYYLHKISKFMEPEVVYFKKNFGLGIQCHPELLSSEIYNAGLKYLAQITIKKFTQYEVELWSKESVY